MVTASTLVTLRTVAVLGALLIRAISPKHSPWPLFREHDFPLPWFSPHDLHLTALQDPLGETAKVLGQFRQDAGVTVDEHNAQLKSR